jgi:hypothetical protein
MDRLFDAFWVVGALQLLIAAVMISAGVGLLRLRPWGRTGAEVLAWLGLVYNVSFGTLWCWTLIEMTRNVPREAGAAGAIPMIMLAFGVVMIVAFCVPLVVIIRVLRGKTVRNAIAAGHVVAVAHDRTEL